jgi:hypothetical protein
MGKRRHKSEAENLEGSAGGGVVRLEGRTDVVEVENSIAAGVPLLHADSIGHLDARGNLQLEHSGPGYWAYIGTMRINPTNPRQGKRVQQHSTERIRGKSTALIPELPWKKKKD